MIKIIDMNDKEVWINPDNVESVYRSCNPNFYGVQVCHTVISLVDDFYMVDASVEEVLRLLERKNAS